MASNRDEKVDGAKIAAEILKRLPAAQQKRLLTAIEDSSPQAAAMIQLNYFSFSNIASLPAKSIQTLVREVRHNDLVMSLKSDEGEVRDAVFENVSAQKRALIIDDLESLPVTREVEIEEAQRRILKRLEELKTQGLIKTASKGYWA
ncbi:MAG: hypothetical protein DCC75_07345 [Proteobacteria bacterium]|nr:MAG: hypothetical protein DCC75_07345 [Pseudomonadota bacterium]